ELSRRRQRKVQPPLPTPQQDPWALKSECRDPAGRTRGAGRAPSTPLSSSEAAAAVSFPGSLTALGPSPGWNTERGSSTAEPQPARYAVAVLPRTRPGFVAGLWGHRLREPSITAEPFGKCSSERDRKGSGVPEAGLPAVTTFQREEQLGATTLGCSLLCRVPALTRGGQSLN
ncbi:hypothetical protein CapIbe_018371, partial [Capra ibex]